MKTYIHSLYLHRAHQLAVLLIVMALLAVYRPGDAVAAVLPPPTSTPTPAPPDPLAAALRPAFAGDAADATLPRYNLRLRLDLARRTLSGSEQIVYRNRTGAPLGDVALRLYPNFPRDVFGKGGDTRMDITGASVDGRPVVANYAAQRTATLLPLAQPLAPDAATTLVVSFTATIKPWRDGTWALTSYYPMLAVHEGDSWRLDVTRFADRVYVESALYEAAITVPTRLGLIASGSTVSSKAGSDGTTTYRVVAGPVREFAWAAGDVVAAHATTDDGIAVHVAHARSNKLDAAQVAQVAAGALADFERRFGAYPYRELDIVLLPGDFDGGDEFPGLILLYSDAQVDAGTRYVTAHEVAHQWWYGIVGNDIYNQPWLDEAFAQYSGIVYSEDMVGAKVAAADWEREVMTRYRAAQREGNLPVGLAISQFPSFNVYYHTVYGKGPVFLRQLRTQLGDEVFFKALQRYYAEHRYGVGTTAAVQQAFEQASGRDLGALFGAWVTGR